MPLVDPGDGCRFKTATEHAPRPARLLPPPQHLHRRRPDAGLQRHRAIPWTGVEVFALFFAMIYWQFFFSALLRWLKVGEPAEAPRFFLLVMAFAQPAQLLTVWLVLHFIRGAQAYQL